VDEMRTLSKLEGDQQQKLLVHRFEIHKKIKKKDSSAVAASSLVQIRYYLYINMKKKLFKTDSLVQSPQPNLWRSTKPAGSFDLGTPFEAHSLPCIVKVNLLPALAIN
jgi:hypothetical protein